MQKKALLKKDLGKLKQGTILHFVNGVFAHDGHTFMPEDIYFDDIHFEILEEESSFDRIFIEEITVAPVFS